MIKNIVFDMGNVLVQYNTDFYLRDYPENEKILLDRQIYRSVDWLRLDRGELTEAELISKIKKRLPDALCGDAERLIKWYEQSEPVDGMEKLITDLHEYGYKIYLLSNTSLEFHKFREKISALKYFDGEFISADCGLLKPDERIYRIFCEHFSLTPSECMFIDDSPANIESAAHVGLNGIVFYGDVALLREQLIENHIII